MPARIVVRGQTVWASRSFKKIPITRKPTFEDGTPIDDFRIEPESADEPFRAGTSYLDPEEQIEYRVVRANLLVPAQGWGTAEFWCERWNCSFGKLVRFVSKGWIDAAIEEGTEVRRYRCRDEARVLAVLSGDPGVHRTKVARAPGARGARPKSRR